MSFDSQHSLSSCVKTGQHNILRPTVTSDSSVWQGRAQSFLVLLGDRRPDTLTVSRLCHSMGNDEISRWQLTGNVHDVGPTVSTMLFRFLDLFFYYLSAFWRAAAFILHSSSVFIDNVM